MRFNSVLLIDDDPEDRDLFLTALERLDSAPVYITYSSAREALRVLDAGEFKPDVIFVDLNMPIMTGHQFLSEKQQRPLLGPIPTYVLTTTAERGPLDQAERLGASGAITKPDSMDKLVELIKSILS